MNQAVSYYLHARALRRHLRSGRDEILRFQTLRLRELVEHAYVNVPYYRRLFDAHGVTPSAIRSAADLSRIPITSKKELHTAPVTDVLAAGADPRSLVTRATGGSTGMALAIRRNRVEDWLAKIPGSRFRRYYGRGLRDLQVTISVVRPYGFGAPQWRPRQAFRGLGLMPHEHLSCLLPIPELARRLAQIRPDVLVGYPSLLARLGQYLVETGTTSVRPHLVMTGAEVRTPEMRDQIRAAFGAGTFDTYGSHEFNRIASECRETGAYHVSDDSIVLEVVDENGREVAPGERGEVVGTALFARTMPFIRYRLGDLVVKGWDVCACGMPFSTIHSIQGRVVDYFTLPDGRLMHPYELSSATVQARQKALLESGSSERPFSWLGQYRYVQERRDHVTLSLVPLREPPAGEIEGIERSVREVLGPLVSLDIKVVPQLDVEPNGKFRVYRSYVEPAAGPPIALAEGDGGMRVP